VKPGATVLIKGAGEHATGTAIRLFRCGFRVVMTDRAHPTAVRRAVAFCEAVPDGEAVVDGVRGVGWSLSKSDALDAFDWSHIPVVVDPGASLVERWRPDVLIDARILKRNLDNRIDQASLVIGFGPGLVAGRDVHLVIETDRGHDLGRIIRKGMSRPDTGAPGEIGGYSIERVLRSPTDGVLAPEAGIGDLVQAGDAVAFVGEQPVRAGIDGVLRGLIRPGPVSTGQKVGDVDPRGDRAACFSLSDKTRTLSGGALEAILSWEPPGDG